MCSWFFIYSGRKGRKWKIKSWRVWIEFQDGDWTAETFRSLNQHQRKNTEQLIRDGYDVWPWPNDGSPSDSVKRETLKEMNMVNSK